MMSGKSLTEHITDLVSKSLSDNDCENTNLYSFSQIRDFEKRLSDLESIVSNREYLGQKLKPFTNSEAVISFLWIKFWSSKIDNLFNDILFLNQAYNISRKYAVDSASAYSFHL